MDEEDRTNKVLKDLDITSYDNVDKIISQPEITPKNKRKYLNKVLLHNAKHRRSQLPGYKTQLKLAYKRDDIGEAEKTQELKRVSNARDVLAEYIKYYETEKEEMKGSGIRKRSGNVMFFNKPKTLQKKLELIIGEIIASNTSTDMRNVGVPILGTLFTTSAKNKAQHAKFFKKYF